MAKNILRTSWIATLFICIGTGVVHAADPLANAGEPQSQIWRVLLNCAIFGFMGILMVTIGFKMFDLIITKIDLQEEINKGNVAAAILSAAAILAIGIIVATAIH
jgi:putative membrane protein